MTTDLRIMALIPARAGSKRVKDKNLRNLGGLPLIGHKIKVALESKYINRIIISTNSEEIKNIAESFGLSVPFLRPEEISGDDSTELEFHQHALNWLSENEKYIPDLIVNLYPTSPLVQSATIDLAIKKVIENPECDSLRSVVKCSEHPYKMWIEKNDIFLEPFIKSDDDNTHTLSYHMLPEVFIQNTCIYITKPETINRYKSTIGKKVLSFIMDEIESFDINSELDFMIAEKIISNRKDEILSRKEKE
jgi:CMP-N-acetylneuraminic acid synthetase